MRTLVVLGACGGARETYWVVQERFPGTKVAFVSDLTDVESFDMAGDRVPVVRDWDFARLRRETPGAEDGCFEEFVVGMGDPAIKRIMVEKALSHGLRPAPPLISPYATVRPDSSIGVGSVIQPNSFVSTNVILGDFVIIHNARMGHDCRFANYVTLNPGCNVAGHVTLGEGVSLGAGTLVKQRLTLAPWVVTGMQACVVHTITEPGITVVGVPAKKLAKAPAAPGADASHEKSTQAP